MGGTFALAQDTRHLADDDRSARFLRQVVLTPIADVGPALRDRERIRNDPAARLDLLSLLSWDRMKGGLR